MYNMYTKGILKTGTGDYDLVANGHVTQEQLDGPKREENTLHIKAFGTLVFQPLFVQDVYAAKGSKTFWHYELQNGETQTKRCVAPQLSAE